MNSMSEMYMTKVYITPDYIFDKLSDKDKQRFNKCIFTDVRKDANDYIEISCMFFENKTKESEVRYRLNDNAEISLD